MTFRPKNIKRGDAPPTFGATRAPAAVQRRRDALPSSCSCGPGRAHPVPRCPGSCAAPGGTGPQRQRLVSPSDSRHGPPQKLKTAMPLVRTDPENRGERAFPGARQPVVGPTPGSTQAVERGSASERRGPRHNTERPRGVRLRERSRTQAECWVSPHVKGLRHWGAGPGGGRGRCLPGTGFQFGTVRKLWGRRWCRDGCAALGMCSTPPSRARRLRHVSPRHCTAPRPPGAGGSCGDTPGARWRVSYPQPLRCGAGRAAGHHPSPGKPRPVCGGGPPPGVSRARRAHIRSCRVFTSSYY